VALAQACATAFDYLLSPDDFTLSGEAYLNRWREHPGPEQPSVIVLDELAGAGAGDARRSMSNKNVNLGRSWQLMRKKKIVTICTLPHWSDADKRLRRSADYRIWCLRQPIGYYRPYKVDCSFDRGDVRTQSYKNINRIKFPNLDALDDEYYRIVTEKKDKLLASDEFDADEITEQEDEPEPADIEREQKIEDAQRARDKGLSTREVSDIVDMSQSWVNKYTSAADAQPADD